MLRFRAVRMESTVLGTYSDGYHGNMITIQGIVLHIVCIACSLTYST